MSTMQRKITAAVAAWAFVVAPLAARRSPAVASARSSTLAAAAASQRDSGHRNSATARGFTRYVNTFVGTDNDGNTFPGATVPLGMVQWSPDTTATGWYKYTDAKIRGFSLTHFSGAGCPAYADVPFMPAVGALKDTPGVSWGD